jgi:hypothetical protein
METETRRALELESAVRQGAGNYPRCYADQKEGKGTEADANTADTEFGETAGQLARQMPSAALAGSAARERGPIVRTGSHQRSRIPSPPGDSEAREEANQDSGIFTPADVHDILWAMVGYSCLGTNDYTDAERVTGERLRARRIRHLTG